MAKKEGVQIMFDTIAPDYDKLNHILSLNVDKGWRKKAVRQIIDTDAPLRILDVACGTGDFLIEIAEKANKESLLQGIDISEEMMKIGREKIKKHGFTAKLEQADCEALPFDNDTFDRISVGFGVRNFEHLSLGIKEMCRVLKPNGKLVILELSVPTNPFFRWCYKYSLQLVAGYPAIKALINICRLPCLNFLPLPYLSIS